MHDPQVRQPFVRRIYLVPTYDPANPRESAALSILGDVLGEGIASRLAQALQLDQKVAIDTGAYYTASRRDQTEFSVYGVPVPEQDLAAVEAAIDAVLRQLAADGPTDEEMARVKRLNRAALIFAQDDVSSQARLYGSSLAAGWSVADVQGWPAVIEAVTAEEVRLAASKYLVPERSVTGWLMGAKESE
jgi:zinc protease